MLAISIRSAALDPDHTVLTIRSHVLQLGAERPIRLLRQLAEILQGRAAAPVIACHRAPARQVPHGLIHELHERIHVARVERPVSAPHRGDVFSCSHDQAPSVKPTGASPGRWSLVSHRRTAESPRRIAPATVTHTTPAVYHGSIWSSSAGPRGGGRVRARRAVIRARERLYPQGD